MGDEDKINGESSSPDPEKEKQELDDAWMHQFSAPKTEYKDMNLDSPITGEPETISPMEKRQAVAVYGAMEKKEMQSVSPAPKKEIVALVLSVILSDVFIYRGGGFTGYALLLPILALFLFFFSRETKRGILVYIMMGLVFLVGLRLFYLGSIWCVLFGIFLLFALAMGLRGFPPFLPEGVLQSFIIFWCAPLNFEDYSRRLSISSSKGKKRFSLKIILAPMGAVLIFGFIFIMANPVLKDFFSEWVNWFYDNFKNLIPGWRHILFWGFVLWCMAGLLYPRIEEYLLKKNETIQPEAFPPAPDHYYPAFRNVLFSLIALFAFYFVFEFYYLWWKEIPRGFRYSDYAHQGAAWLTFALALSTLVIGATFRGGILLDSRIPFLKKLAWIWSAENFILAVCAFHRTQIYVHYNGLSRMRVVAVFGIAVVVAGFILVILKVAWRKNLLWLIRRHLWALALTILLYLIIPVDYFVTKYNVKQILSGNPAPSVQIAVHPIGSDGCTLLLDLLECQDESIREGVRALLAKTQFELEVKISKKKRQGWTFFQLAETRALEKMQAFSNQWKDLYDNRKKRQDALQIFDKYGRKWYH